MMGNLGLKDVSILHDGDRGDAEHHDGEDDRQADGGESGDHADVKVKVDLSVELRSDDLTGPGVSPQLWTGGGVRGHFNQRQPRPPAQDAITGDQRPASHNILENNEGQRE